MKQTIEKPIRMKLLLVDSDIDNPKKSKKIDKAKIKMMLIHEIFFIMKFAFSFER